MTPRRTAALLGVLAMVLSGCASEVPNAPTTNPPTVAAPQTPTPIPVPSVDPDSITNLGPDSAGPIELGMTKADVAQTGAATALSGTEGTCGQPADGRLIGAMPADDSDVVGQLFFATDTGKLVVIAATPGISTPEGIHLGSRLSAVKKAYPAWKGDEDAYQGAGLVPVPENEQAVYRIYVDAGQVLELSLQSRTQDCF